MPSHEIYQRFVIDPDKPAETAGQPGKYRQITVVFLSLITAGGLALWFGDDFAVLGAMLAVGTGCITLGYLLSDALGESPRDRSRSRQAVICYLGAVRRGHWKGAFACLSEHARTKPAQVPQIPELETRPEAVVLNSPEQVRRYFGTISRSTGRRVRHISSVRLLAGEILAPNVHRYRCILRVRHYPKWIVLSFFAGVIPLVLFFVLAQHLYELRFETVVVRQRSQWWLLSGEIAAELVHHDATSAQLPEARIAGVWQRVSSSSN